MRIVFFTHYFPPEVNAPANRTHEHCREWVDRGHEVHVVTCVPSHPVGRPFPGYRRSWYRHDVIDGVHVHRVWTYLAPNKGVAKRVVNYISFIPTAVYRAMRLGPFDVAVGTSPQFFCAVATWAYTKLRRTPFVFELRDLWPESIPAVGAMRRSFALRLLERLELRMYRDAAAVVCVTRSFVRSLTARGIDESKLHFVPNGVLTEFWQRASREDERARLGVGEGTVLVSYVGTLGMAHNLVTVLEAAAVLQRTDARIRFLIAGDGAELDRLRAMATQAALKNVHFTGLVSREEVPGLLAASDMALVTLKPSPVFKAVLPSKMFEAMAAGCAILLGVEGEAKATLGRAHAGVAVPPGDVEALTAAIHDLAGQPEARRRMGAAGAEFVAREFSRRAWAERYVRLLADVAGCESTLTQSLQTQTRR